MADDMLSFIQQWYSAHCDGEWEHGYSIKIETIDNPGWFVKINLADTELARHAFDLPFVERSENDWLRCWVEDAVFNIACGPNNLIEGLAVFKNWASERGQDQAEDVRS